jgi:hypothetical protein
VGATSEPPVPSSFLTRSPLQPPITFPSKLPDPKPKVKTWRGPREGEETGQESRDTFLQREGLSGQWLHGKYTAWQKQGDSNSSLKRKGEERGERTSYPILRSW